MIFVNKPLNNFILFWNKESIGFLLSSRFFFYILKEYLPNSKITLLVSNEVFLITQKAGVKEALGLQKNDEIISLKQFLLKRSIEYDVAISPTMRNYSIINHLIIKFNSAKIKIGFYKINKSKNPYKFSFNHQLKFDWSQNPDVHFSEIPLQLLKPLGIEVKNKFHLLNFYSVTDDKKSELKKKYGVRAGQKIIGINNSPEDQLNKWDSKNLVQLISSFCESGNYFFYFVGESLESNMEVLLKQSQQLIPKIEKNNFSELVDLFASSDLVITCDSRTMHTVGYTNVNQISLFGVRNPFNWAPLGNNKKFISKSDLVDDIDPKEVFELSKILLRREK